MMYMGETTLKEIFDTLIGYFAPKNSPTFTGTPTAPTPEDNAGGTQIATVDYVKAHGGNGSVDLSEYAKSNDTKLTGNTSMENLVASGAATVTGGATISGLTVNGDTQSSFNSGVEFNGGTTFNGGATFNGGISANTLNVGESITVNGWTISIEK